MHDLIIHPDAEADFERLGRIDKWAAARFFVLLEQLDADDDLLDRLSQHGFEKDKPLQFSISRWEEACRNGRYLYRLKIWDANDQVLPYRMIYAHIPGDEGDSYHVLAIAERAWDYDMSSTLTKRIFEAYENLPE